MHTIDRSAHVYIQVHVDMQVLARNSCILGKGRGRLLLATHTLYMYRAVECDRLGTREALYSSPHLILSAATCRVMRCFTGSAVTHLPSDGDGGLARGEGGEDGAQLVLRVPLATSLHLFNG